MGQPVAIYCRVSTADQSCDRQERDLRAFAKRAGFEIVAVFKETASGAKNDRAERNKVMALARARKIDAILVTELSRWGRSTQDLVQTLDDLHGWKVSVLAQTGLSYDLRPDNPLWGKDKYVDPQCAAVPPNPLDWYQRSMIRAFNRLSCAKTPSAPCVPVRC